MIKTTKTMKKTYITPRVTIIDAYGEELMNDVGVKASATSYTATDFNNTTSVYEDGPGIDNSGSNSDVTDARGGSFWDDWDD